MAEGVSDTYNFEDLVLHRLGIIDADKRMLRNSNAKKTRGDIVDAAKDSLGDAPSEDNLIATAVSFARSADEAWFVHRNLTGIYRDDLAAIRLEKLAAAISERFPA